MSRNDRRPTTRSLPHRLRRSQGVWLLIALVLGLGTWSSRLSGQNAASSTDQSPNVVTDTPAPNRSSSIKKTITPNLDRFRTPRPSSAAAPTVGSTRSQKPGASTANSNKRDGVVQQASHEELSDTAPGNFGISPDVPSKNVVPSSLPPMTSQIRPAVPGPTFAFPQGRTVPPQITGSHLGLQPGETATERSLRLVSTIADLEEQIAQLAEQNAKLNAELKARDAKLQSSTALISGARKELSLATEEFQRLRKEIADLRAKFQSAERENAALMRSLSPLLKQILQSDDDPPMPDKD